MSENKTIMDIRFDWVGLLGVSFIVLKLTGYISWSWWWVTLPLWGGVALVLASIIALGIIYLIAKWWE